MRDEQGITLSNLQMTYAIALVVAYYIVNVQCRHFNCYWDTLNECLSKHTDKGQSRQQPSYSEMIGQHYIFFSFSSWFLLFGLFLAFEECSDMQTCEILDENAIA